MTKTSLAVAALALGSLFTASAMAKDVDLKACTADGNTATLTAHFNDEALKHNPELPKQLNAVFVDTAKGMPAKTFTSDEGGQAFLRKALDLDHLLYRHVNFTSDPIITPGCSL